MSTLEKFENTIDLFVEQNSLQPADAIMVKKMPMKLLNHYIIYLGIYDGYHSFMANTLSGIKVYNYYDLMKALEVFTPQRIDKFVGDDYDREEAVERALQRLNENSYNLILNNCEHLKNWVQDGVHKSSQVENVGKVAIAAGGVVALSSKNKGGVYAGIAVMVLGGLAWAFSRNENIFPKQQEVSN